MKMMVAVVLAFVAVSYAIEDPFISIVRSEYNQQPEGSYQFGFESQNGIVRSETGEVKQALDEENKPRNVIYVRGSYSYTDPEGVPVSVSYFADENGYHAEGDSIPKPARR